MAIYDLEALAREQEEKAALSQKWADHYTAQIAQHEASGDVPPLWMKFAASYAAEALAHRQAAALISAQAPGREEIAREFEKLLSPYGVPPSLTEYDSGRKSAFGLARDVILALFHAPAAGERG